MAQPALDRGSIEKVGVVIALQIQRVRPLHKVEKQIKVQRALRIPFAFEFQAFEFHGTRVLINVEDYFYQRGPSRAARNFNFLKDASNGALIMIERV